MGENASFIAFILNVGFPLRNKIVPDIQQQSHPFMKCQHIERILIFPNSMYSFCVSKWDGLSEFSHQIYSS